MQGPTAEHVSRCCSLSTAPDIVVHLIGTAGPQSGKKRDGRSLKLVRQARRHRCACGISAFRAHYDASQRWKKKIARRAISLHLSCVTEPSWSDARDPLSCGRRDSFPPTRSSLHARVAWSLTACHFAFCPITVAVGGAG